MIVNGYKGIIDLDLSLIDPKFHKDAIEQHYKDIEEYKKAGADHFGVSTICFSPLGLMRLYWNYMTTSSSG